MNRLNQLTTRARGMLSGFTPGQRGVILVAVAALVLGAIALGRWAAQPTWAPLFSNLSGASANAVVEQLTTDNVPYQLANNGTTVLVPQEQVYGLRISLQGKGVVNGSSGGTAGGSDSGYSVLDSQGMTATDFQQNIAYQRALESELSKTLQAIGGVNTAIVHLAIPKKDVFTTDTDHPTASVLLATASGTSLSRAQIRSVMHLVAGSVPGLDPSDVTVSDATGALLSVREDGQDGSATASDNDTQTQQFEDAKSKAAQAILDKVVGVGHSVVRVNAELNFDSSETTSDTYQTASGTLPPLYQATSSESYDVAGSGAGGVLGAAYPTLTPGASAGKGGYVHVQSTVTNPVNHIVGKVQAAPGTPERLTVAVVLDSATAAQLDAKQIQDLIANAVGISPARGDTVQVNKLAFDTAVSKAAAKELADSQAATRTNQYLDLGKKTGLGLALLIVALIVMRKRKKPPVAKVEVTASDLPEPETASLLPLEAEEQLMISAMSLDVLGTADADILDPTLERERLRDEVAKFVDSQPEEIAAIVQGWLGQRKT